MKRVIVGIAFAISTLSLNAQEYPKEEIDISQIADELYGIPDEELDYEDLYENLVQLLAHPIDLNKGTQEDFRMLNVLTESQIKALLHHRETQGNIISVYELQAIPGFDLPTVQKIAPFVTVKEFGSTIDASFLKRVKKESTTYFLTRYERTLQPKAGHKTETEGASRFKGTPEKIYARFRSSRPGDFSFGFTVEKDAGEAWRWSPSTKHYGMDYVSFHAQIQNKGRLKNFIIGDYQCQFGQGLMLGGVFGMGKGGETITSIRRSNIGLLPYTSAYEAGAMSGMAFTFQATKKISITTLFSNNKKDGSMSSTGQDDIISSFQYTGLHRNEKELEKRKAIGERNVAGIIQYKHGALDAGLMYHATLFDAPVERAATAYNQFAFSGDANYNLGLYINYSIQNVAFFSELARSAKGGQASTAGVLLNLSSRLELSVLYRKYDRNFYTFYTSGFGEGSTTQNEQGIYWGWKYTFSRRYGFSGYFDLFRFPWLRFRSYAPSDGYEWLLRFSYAPSRNVKIFLQAREEVKSRNIEEASSTLYKLAQGKKNNYWISLDYSPHAMFRLKSKAQFSTFAINAVTTRGLALIQDLQIDFGRMKVTMRYALFDTDDYDNRQYSYENDVWLAYSLPAYAGAGVRKMIVAEYKVSKRLSIAVRYAHIRYTNQSSIGNGLDRIEGDTRNDVKAQVVIRL